ncbi:hypothetical protein BJ085DRAFT_29823 [Dimargaris cristalligena]|uniref:F-box domain-containing protein n=1 Tax=Dimargaris cristalligena TaxID=215637 RepID=A0A4P9ZQF7_9FUNG|nr:hypothetical protein BJ085DRAFT_29823 [Dimargaris cristalligena]|eukprot:RKP34961.1 hypothetical protein BJ085DRAFT_29823 [Dimargaris cristalligena]
MKLFALHLREVGTGVAIFLVAYSHGHPASTGRIRKLLGRFGLTSEEQTPQAPRVHYTYNDVPLATPSKLKRIIGRLNPKKSRSKAPMSAPVEMQDLSSLVAKDTPEPSLQELSLCGEVESQLTISKDYICNMPAELQFCIMNYLTIEEQARYTGLSCKLRPLFLETLNNMRKNHLIHFSAPDNSDQSTPSPRLALPVFLIKSVLGDINQRAGSTLSDSIEDSRQYFRVLRTPLQTSLAFFTKQNILDFEPNDSGNIADGLVWVDYSKLGETQRLLEFPFVEGLCVGNSKSWGRAMANLLSGDYPQVLGTWATQSGTDVQKKMITAYFDDHANVSDDVIAIPAIVNSMFLAVGQAFRRRDYSVIDSALAAFLETVTPAQGPVVRSARYFMVRIEVHYRLHVFLTYLATQTGNEKNRLRYVDALNKLSVAFSKQERTIMELQGVEAVVDWAQDQPEPTDLEAIPHPPTETLERLEIIYPTNFLNFLNPKTILVRVDSVAWSTAELGELREYGTSVSVSSDNRFYQKLDDIWEPSAHLARAHNELSWLQEAMDATADNAIQFPEYEPTNLANRLNARHADLQSSNINNFGNSFIDDINGL